MIRLVRRIGGIVPDIWSGIATLACVVPFAGVLAHTGVAHLGEINGVEDAVSLLTLPLAISLLGYPQILMALMVRRVAARKAKATGALASLALAVWYAIWAAGADLTGNSTASLALVFYPIMIQGWAWLTAFATVLVVARMHRPSEG
jgi:hypothetical protein